MNTNSNNIAQPAPKTFFGQVIAPKVIDHPYQNTTPPLAYVPSLTEQIPFDFTSSIIDETFRKKEPENKAISIINNLVNLAEVKFDKPGQGKKKKSFVSKLTGLAFKALGIDSIKSEIEETIDTLVEFKNQINSNANEEAVTTKNK